MGGHSSKLLYHRIGHKPIAMLILGFESLVAVHGLLGDRVSTWTTESDDNCLRDKIYDGFPGAARILSFGYDNSDGSPDISTRAGIRQTARRLLDELVKLRNPSDPVREKSTLPGNRNADMDG